MVLYHVKLSPGSIELTTCSFELSVGKSKLLLNENTSAYAYRFKQVPENKEPL